MSAELMRRSCEQIPYQGIRRTRHAIIRNTYRELTDTTLKTWLEWFKEEKFGHFNHQQMIHEIRFNDVESDILFRALDRPADIKKLLSLELTGAWINEAKEIPLGLVNGVKDAIGRYPPEAHGGPTWWGLIMDTNPPHERHWWYNLAEKERPLKWEFWRQPGGLIEKDGEFLPNPDAENLENLTGGSEWYLNRAYGAPHDHIRVYYCGQYGFIQEGKPVYPEYFDALHASQEILTPVAGIKIIVGIDFGLTPAALFCQRQANGRWIWFDELCTQEMGAARFSELLKPKLNEYAKWPIEIYGDPAGATRSQTDEKTCYQILAAAGIEAAPAPSNVFTLRREAVASALRRIIDGKPGLIISPKCQEARLAMAGAYHFRKMQIINEEIYHEEPEKNQYSHIAEAGQYAMLGAGEGELLVKTESPELLQSFKRRSNAGQHGNFGWMF